MAGKKSEARTCAGNWPCFVKTFIQVKNRRLDFSNCMTWFKFTAFGRIADYKNQCGAGSDASCRCWLVADGQLRLGISNENGKSD